MKITRKIESSPVGKISQVDPLYVNQPSYKNKPITRYEVSPSVINDVNLLEAQEIAIENVLLSDNLQDLEYYLELLYSMGVSEKSLKQFPVEDYKELNPNLIPLLKQLKQKYEKDPSKISKLGLLLSILLLFGISA